jgi:alpha-amylase/alpha-mannosidase (GH57 family)
VGRRVRRNRFGLGCANFLSVYNGLVNLCFLLHFYQPSNQFGDVVKKVTQECYIPLIKAIKNDKRIKVTANFSLSLLEQLDCYGFNWLIRDIKDLVTAGRIELVGSAAYHPLLTKIPQDFVDKQVILNECSLAYYFGVNKDFEGEDCLMVKGLHGFFPPEMAINADVLEILGELGYEWVSVDEFCLPKDSRGTLNNGFVYSLGSHIPKLIVRNRTLTDLISFKRDLDRSAIVAEILNDSSDKIVALDAETFGHHYSDGLYLFESIISDSVEKGIEIVTISEAVQNSEVTRISHIEESTWSSFDGKIYPLWENSGSKVNSELWFLQREIHAEFVSKFPEESPDSDSSQNIGGVPVWKYRYDPRVSMPDLRTRILLDLLKLEQSDQFWWSTEAEIMGKRNFSRYMIDSALDYYVDAAEALGSNMSILARIDEIREILKDQRGQSEL